jgi:hypothetical protein
MSWCSIKHRESFTVLFTLELMQSEMAGVLWWWMGKGMAGSDCGQFDVLFQSSFFGRKYGNHEHIYESSCNKVHDSKLGPLK